MNRVLVLYDVKGWAYYYRATALKKYCPSDFSVDISSDFNQILLKPYEFIIVLPYHKSKIAKCLVDKKYYSKCGVPIISSYNLGSGQSDQTLTNIYPYCTKIIINSKSMYDNYQNKEKLVYIPNGVDLEKFRCLTPMRDRPIKIGWVGSRYHAVVKGYHDMLPFIADRLKDKNIEFEWRLVESTRPKYTHEEMNQFYNTLTSLLVCSKTEGTPNPALEAQACGVPVISTRVGNMPELIQNGLNGYLIDRDINQFISAIEKVISNRDIMSEESIKAIDDWHWQKRSQEYFDLMRKHISNNERVVNNFSRPNNILTPINKKNITRQKNKFEIFAYCSESYRDAYDFVIKSWLSSGAEKITIYSDYNYNSGDSRIEFINMFDKSDDWIVGTGRRLDAIRHYSDKNKGTDKNILFMDIDCLITSPIEHVWDNKDFDIGITRLFNSHQYTSKTATAGLWFARLTPSYYNFIDDWLSLASTYKNEKKGIEPFRISYVQYSFTDVAMSGIKNNKYKILSMDERIYNSERSDLVEWYKDIKKYRPKILHFKGRRFRDNKIVQLVLGNYPHNEQKQIKMFINGINNI